jgi:hypothetical protein
MNSISIIEFLLVGAIVLIQTSLALRTRSQIKFLARIIPALKFFKLKRYNIPIEDLQTFEPREILQNLSAYEKQVRVQPALVNYENGDSELTNGLEEDEFINQNEVSLINPNEKVNIIFDEILLAINVYLLRNKGAAADFNLIKDVVERNLDMEEDDISHTVTVPLYLGLMGTMVGIVFGLINLFLVSDTNADFDIKAFLGGVSIAMFASFWGLFCTVANSSLNLKNARRSLEIAKNTFYTFLQTELLPVLNQSVSSSIHTLNSNLVKFNDNFSINLNKLNGIINKNYDSLIAQEKILQALDSIDISEFAKANIKILKELKSSIEEIDKFNNYLKDLNYLMNTTSRLTNSFDDILSRTNNFYGLAEKLDNRIEMSDKLLHFLSEHFQQLEGRGDIIRSSVVKVEDVMIKSLKQLEEHTQMKIDSIKQITIKEEDLMTQAFAENRSHFSKLHLLEDLKKTIDDFKRNSNENIGGIRKEIASLKTSIDRSNIALNNIGEKKKRKFISTSPKMTKFLKKIFIPKNK